MRSFKDRLAGHFAKVAVAGAALAGSAATADAAIVHSGTVNITIPSTTQGVYLNVATGVNSTSVAAVPGWDINLWGSSGLGFFNPSSPAGGVYVVTAPVFAANLVPGATIDGSSTFGSGSVANSNQWNLDSSSNLFGFRFLNEDTNEVHYGWGRISLSDTIAAQPRAIVEYA